jgi:C-terminal processing protease CtpA/Prc
VPPGGSALKEGTIQPGDTIVTIDNLDVSRGRELSDVSNRIRETKDPLLLDVYRGVGDDIDENEYSEESACPYYLSR